VTKTVCSMKLIGQPVLTSETGGSRLHDHNGSVHSHLMISSYNLRGFQQGQQQLLELCNNHDVIAVQEHWLADCDLNKIVNLNTDFSVIARSAMTDKLQQGLLRGRPFGGLALMFRKSLCTHIKYIGVEPSCRGLAAVITLHNNIKLLIINMYLPCFVAGSEYESTVLDSVAFIENCILNYSYDSLILLCDFNFECKTQCTGYRILCSLLKEYKLTCCEDAADTDIRYTYYQDTLGRCSVIDHMFIDSSLCHNIINYCTIESGVNFSDHVPISCLVAVQWSVSTTLHLSLTLRDKAEILRVMCYVGIKVILVHITILLDSYCITSLCCIIHCNVNVPSVL